MVRERRKRKKLKKLKVMLIAVEARMLKINISE